jgi:hypothetical protein
MNKEEQSKAQRFMLGGEGLYEDDNHGHWVLYSDYKKLEEENKNLKKDALFSAVTVLPDKDREIAELQKEVERLRELAHDFKDGVYSLGMQHGKSFSDTILKYRELVPPKN